MKKENLYESPVATTVAIQTEGAFLSASTDVGAGIKDLTYEDIQWN